MILTALVNSVTDTEIFKIKKQPPEVFLKFKLKFHKVHGKTPTPGASFLIKLQGLDLQQKRLQHRCFPVNLKNFLRMPFRKATVSKNMKAFKLQVISGETKDCLNPHNENKLTGLHFSKTG